MPEIKLKPCPFCGCELSEFPEVMIVHRDYTDDYIDWKHSKGDFVGSNDYRVHCENCGARGRSATTKEKAVEAWNRRSCKNGNINWSEY